MYNTLTINQLLKIMQDIAYNIEYIKYFNIGRPYNISAEEPVKHPYIWVDILSAELIQSDNNIYKDIIIYFDIYCLDIINKDEDNYIEIISDTFLFLNMYLKLLNDRLNNENKLYKITNDIKFDCVYEAFNEGVNGWKSSVNIKIPNYLSKCNILSNE